MVTEGLAATVHTAVIIYISVHHVSTTPLGTDGALRMFGQIGIHLGIALGYAYRLESPYLSELLAFVPAAYLVVR